MNARFATKTLNVSTVEAIDAYIRNGMKVTVVRTRKTKKPNTPSNKVIIKPLKG